MRATRITFRSSTSCATKEIYLIKRSVRDYCESIFSHVCRALYDRNMRRSIAKLNVVNKFLVLYGLRYDWAIFDLW